MDALLSFLISAFALTGSPGPNTLSLAAVGASFGRARGMAYMAGLNLGVVLVIALVGSGLSGLVLAVPGVRPLVTAAAVAYFLYLAWKIANAPPLRAPDTVTTAPRWVAGVFLSLSNPKAYAAMAALFSGHVLRPGQPVPDALTKAALIVAVILLVNLAWLTIGAALTRALRNPRAARAVNITFALLLLLSVALSVM
ncbi:LysE family translocator [Thalassovita sp.]|uniref:LysE family translocator n=1 Tax=Thalassovita sp. TaxID=1979401 RepID=UPI0029DE8762|nr:LysE family translocator [Thalassovita sp.]